MHKPAEVQVLARAHPTHWAPGGAQLEAENCVHAFPVQQPVEQEAYVHVTTASLPPASVAASLGASTAASGGCGLSVGPPSGGEAPSATVASGGGGKLPSVKSDAGTHTFRGCSQ